MRGEEVHSTRSTNRWAKSLGVFIILIAAAVATSGVAVAQEAGTSTGQTSISGPDVDAPEVKEAVGHANALSKAFRAAARETLPAVVTIKHIAPAPTRTQRPQGGGQGFDEDAFKGTPFEEFFKGREDLFNKRFFEQLPQQQPRGRSGTGTGFIVDSSGIILTNNHVVSGGGKVLVELHDGRELEATKVKTDPRTDLAVVWLEGAGELPTVKLGDSDKLEIGDWVIAVGSPFGLSESVTAGIISAKGRGIGVAQREDFLQTDAAINPGNSGGPLVNLNGEVIGINTAISSRTGGYQGIGFAIPINLAKWVTQQLIEDGKVSRAYLGVAIQPVTSELAEQLGVAVGEGALISQVMSGTPADKAGLQPGDVIVQFGGEQIGSSRDLVAAAEAAEIGKKVDVVIVRDGKKQTVQVVPRQQPQQFGTQRPSTTQRPDRGTTFDELGMEIAPLSQEAAESLDLDAGQGVEITGVVRGSIAENAGLSPGMVVTQVNRQKVTSAEEFRAAMKKNSLEEGILMLVHSEEGARFVVLSSNAS